MPIYSISTLRSSFSDARGRAFTAVYRQPSPLARLLAGALVLMVSVLLLAVFLILVIPALLIFVGVAVVGGISQAIRRAIRSTREPNGILDGRRNVRVIEPDSEA